MIGNKSKSVKRTTKNIYRMLFIKNKRSIFIILSFLVFGIMIFVFFSKKNNQSNSNHITNTQKNTNISQPVATPTINDIIKYNEITEKVTTSDKNNPYFKYQDLEWRRSTQLSLRTYLKNYSEQNNTLVIEKNGDIKIKTPSDIQIISAPKNDKYKYLAWGWDCGGFTGYVFVLTENGQIYKLNFHPFDDKDKKTKSEITKIVLSEKIIDMTLKVDIQALTCSVSKYYFLTNSGQIIDQNKHTWEENNPHISIFGNAGSYVFIFNDGSFSLTGNQNQKIKDKNQLVKISKIFSVQRGDRGYLDFYIINNDNNLFKFSPILNDKLGISNTTVIKYTSKIVKNIQPQFEPIDTVIVNYDDGSQESFIQSSHGYYDFAQKKYIY